MIDLPWKVFTKTGSVETYLLMKQTEEAYRSAQHGNRLTDSKISITNQQQ